MKAQPNANPTHPTAATPTAGSAGIPSGREYYERSLTVALLRARESTMRRFKRYADAEDMTLPQWRVLRALADGEPLDAGTLCQRCVILPPSLTRILRALAERGLILQVACSDARRHMVTLTPKGKALFDDLVVQSEETRREIDQAFGTEKMQLLLDLLNELREITEDLPDPE
ncbi:homoprotocatechuate degradation operon regulator HpaR [Pararhodobacter oceanensis]|uniref:homoprotocatechuate degradation operon regulator HpaR n=1 Tax=Pararhodobacter oceanensis TaxID=2172121 RepID=UPI003A900337